MDFWSALQLHKWYAAGWILLFVLSFAVLFFDGEKWVKQIRYIIIFVLLSIGLYFCPFFARLATGSFLPGYLEYERITWLVFTREIIALAFTIVIEKLDKQKKRIAIVCFVAFCVFVSNITLISRDFKVPENWYKVPKDVIVISNALVEDSSEKKPAVLIQEEEYDVDKGESMYHGIRQYTSKPILSSVYINSDEFESEGFNLDEYGLMDYEYFVCHNEKSLKTQAENDGFELLAETNEYCLYKNVKEFSLYFVRHGQTEANVEEILAGSGTDAMLTEEGIRQAIDTGKALADVDFSNIFTSELTRTRDTAGYIIGETKGGRPESEIISYLNDFYWGIIEGFYSEVVIGLYPDFNLDTYTGALDDPYFVSPIGSWSRYETVCRYRNAMARIAAKTTNGGNALVVGHNAMIWYFQTAFSNQVNEEDDLDNASITVLHYCRGTWTLEYLNLSAEEYEKLGL